MARSLKDLADDLEALAARLPQQATNQKSKRVAEIILTDLLRQTPVDTGQAIANWRITLNIPSDDIFPPYIRGDKGSTQQLNQEIALEAGLAVLSAKQASDVIYISNPLPYIRTLNDGSSTQAPAGFVERAVLIGRLYAENPADF